MVMITLVKNTPQLRIQSVNIWSVYNVKHLHCLTEVIYLINYRDELGLQTTQILDRYFFWNNKLQVSIKIIDRKGIFKSDL